MSSTKFSEWIEFEYLSDSEVCSWLKDNYTTKIDSSLRDKIESTIFNMQDSAKIQYFYCRYAHNADDYYKIEDLINSSLDRNRTVALAANLHFVERAGSISLDRVMQKLIAGFPATDVILRELLHNPSTERYRLTSILEKRHELSAFQDPIFVKFFLSSLVTSPSATKRYDNVYLDGWMDGASILQVQLRIAKINY